MARVEPSELTFKALCALHELAEEAAQAPLEGTFAFRFVLAYLASVSDAPDWLFKQIWRDLRSPDDDKVTGEMRTYRRATNGRTAFQALVRHCGYDCSVAGLQAIEAWIHANEPSSRRERRAAAAAEVRRVGPGSTGPR